MTNPYAAPMSHSKGGPVGDKPSNYLVHSILATLCCCLPLGIVAIVYAAQVDSKWNGGDYQGAVDASQKAKMYCWISLGLGLVVNVIATAIQFAAIASEGNF